jgi:hypothetical protein
MSDKHHAQVPQKLLDQAVLWLGKRYGLDWVGHDGAEWSAPLIARTRIVVLVFTMIERAAIRTRGGASSPGR